MHHRVPAVDTRTRKEYELDDGTLDDSALEALRTPQTHARVGSRGHGRGEQAMPLLVGLVDASAYRSPETPRGESIDVDGGPVL